MRWSFPDVPRTLARPVAARSLCKICGDVADLADVVDFNKYCSRINYYKLGLSGVPVYYYSCRACQFMFTEFFDDWDGEKFSTFVYNDDYARVDRGYTGARPAHQANILDRLFAGATDITVLDYGSGSGLTANLLADKGYKHVECYDPFSHPHRPNRTFDVIVSMAVIEHTPRPMETFREIKSFLNEGGVVLCITGMLTGDVHSRRGAWWYVAPRNGHVSIFTHKAMDSIARTLGLAYYVKGRWCCLLHEPANEVSRHVLRGNMHRFACVRLLAPALPEERPPHKWGPLDRRSDPPVRWTKAQDIQLPLPPLAPGPSELCVEIPFASQARLGFASECRVAVDRQEHPMHVEHRHLGDVLTAQFKIETPPSSVRLLTPSPLPPGATATPTRRKPFGLAVEARAE